MAEIPADLITKILQCLPVKSLLRFRCASKSICSIVDSVEFVNSHLSKTGENMIHRKMIFQDSRFRVYHLNDGRFEVDNQPKLLPYPIQQVYGYCNGLLLLYQDPKKLALWNPSTRQCRNLPDFPFSRIIWSGLGCDSSTDDYKAVFIVYTKLNHIQVWIFEVRSNTWRRVQHKFGSFRFGDKHCFGYFAEGGLHWLPSQQEEILAFDLRKETFSSLPLPPVCSIPILLVKTDLHVLEGFLCISFFYSPRPFQADLYMRNKDTCWTQLYSIKEPIILNTFRFRDMKVLGYSKSRNKIVLDFGMEDLVSYDFETKSFGKDYTKRSPFWYHPILCNESLVSVLGG